MDEHLTYTEAAEQLKVSRATLYRMVRDGILNPIRIPNPSRRGESPRIRREEVSALTQPQENA